MALTNVSVTHAYRKLTRKGLQLSKEFGCDKLPELFVRILCGYFLGKELLHTH